MRASLIIVGVLLFLSVGILLYFRVGVYANPSQSNGMVSTTAFATVTSQNFTCPSGTCQINGNTVLSESQFCAAYEADTGDPCNSSTGTEFVLLSAIFPTSPLILNLGGTLLDMGVLLIENLMVAFASYLIVTGYRKQKQRRHKKT